MKLTRMLMLMGLLMSALGLAQAQSAVPDLDDPGLLLIESIQMSGGEAIVTVRVPPGVAQVVLEYRLKIGAGSWNPKAIQRLEASAAMQRLVFRVPFTTEMAVLRARAEATEPLPANFYEGESQFSTPGTDPNARFAGPVAVSPGGAEDAASQDRAVVESDIWRVRDDKLYFFNQYQGLQVIDVSEPDVPQLQGTYPLAAAGEQMYVLENGRVVLLARDRCSWGAETESEVVLLQSNDGIPEWVASVPVPGTIQESRMVGTALYLVSQRYRPMARPDGATATSWEWGSEVYSIDLADFAAPVLRSREWVAGYSNAIYATDQFLFVASQYWGMQWRENAAIYVFDISSPDGTFELQSTIPVLGQVPDKFKMNLTGTTFSVVSFSWTSGQQTWVENFSLADPASPARVGSLKIVERESLHATRFDGDRLYVVTFFMVDPLWIIDMSDPAAPRKVSELEIPGWSTYIQPLGDRLITIGMERTDIGMQTSVQLFDVSDLENPSLASKVFLGEGYSWSEANSDEKAFGVLPEHSLILVPFQSYKEGEAVLAVQLVDLNEDSLVKRGLILHDRMAPRRSTVHNDRVLSLSGGELLTVDATDRDTPEVTAVTELSWSVDRLAVAGEYLVEVSQPWDAAPSLRVVQTADPGVVVARAGLANLGMAGMAVRGERLYVLQGRSSQVVWPDVWVPEDYKPVATNAATVKLSVYDLAALPELLLVSEQEEEIENAFFSTFKALWPDDETLVWAPGDGAGSFRGWLPGIDMIGGMPEARIGFAPFPYYWGASGSDLVAYDVNGADGPELVSHVRLAHSNSWSISKPVLTGHLIYLSRQTSEWDPDAERPPYVYSEWDGSQSVLKTNYPPAGMWIEKYYLDVVNYEDPREPVVRDPVNIPGRLLGVSHEGAMLYTMAGRYADWATWSGWAEHVEASAYDGLEAHRVASMTLPAEWPRPVEVHAGTVWVGSPSIGQERPPEIGLWEVSAAGPFERVGTVSLLASGDALAFFDDLLAVSTSNAIELFDVTDPVNAARVGFREKPGCTWYNLQDADGALGRGVWVPLGLYGVLAVDATPGQTLP